MATIQCGHCKNPHASVAIVRACSQGQVAPCGWLVERYVGEPGDQWLTVVECGADAIISDRGWACVAGHSHVSMEARHAEGWDYAEDDQEAMDLARAGTEPRDFATGHPTYFPGTVVVGWEQQVADTALAV